MQELWLNSTLWRILINCFGAISILVGGWLIFKLLKSAILSRKAKNIINKKFINIKNLPDIFSNITQICLDINIEQKICLDILDVNENSILNIHNDLLTEGEKIFNLDTKQFDNGYYYIAVKTPYQSIFRKIIVNNS